MINKAFAGDRPHLTKRDINYYSTNDYECVALYESLTNGIVIVAKSRKRNYQSFKVSYNQSNVFFSSFDEAKDFIEKRFKDITREILNLKEIKKYEK